MDVITKSQQVPAFEQLHTKADGALPIRHGDRAFIAILGHSDGTADCLISDDRYEEAMPIVQDILLKAHDNGIAVARQYRASSQIIEELYQSDLAGNRSTEGDAELDRIEMDDMFDNILKKALSLKASDIHIEHRGRQHGMVVRMRVNGTMIQPSAPYPAHVAEHMVNFVYNSLDQGTSESVLIRHVPQGGRLSRFIDDSGYPVRLRYEFKPGMLNTWDITLRILGKENDPIPELADLNYEDWQREVIREHGLASTGSGMLLAAAPTGAGKSTTLRSVLVECLNMHGMGLKAATVEDPAEYYMPPEIRQSEVVRPKGERATEAEIRKRYQALVNSLMRSDPDVVMLGEVRDRPAIEQAVEISITGHLLLTTIHASDSHEAYKRLLIKVNEPELLCTHGLVRMIIAQRLVPALCPHCKLNHEQVFEAATDDETPQFEGQRGKEFGHMMERLLRSGAPLEDVRFRGPGCEHCIDGISGRLPVAELLCPDHQYLKHLIQREYDMARYYWLTKQEFSGRAAGYSMARHSLDRVSRGEIDPRDAEREIAPIDTPAEYGSYAAIYDAHNQWS